MSEVILQDTVETVLLRLKWEYDEFQKNPNYMADTLRPYETIEDWLNEYTGEIIEHDDDDAAFYGEYWSEETFGDVLPGIILGVIEYEPPLSLYSAKNSVSEYFALEVEDVIRNLPISKLERGEKRNGTKNIR